MMPSAGSSRRLGLGQAEAASASVAFGLAAEGGGIPAPEEVPCRGSVVRPVVGGVALGVIMAVEPETIPGRMNEA